MYSLQKSKTFVLCQDIFLKTLSVKLKNIRTLWFMFPHYYTKHQLTHKAWRFNWMHDLKFILICFSNSFVIWFKFKINDWNLYWNKVLALTLYLFYLFNWQDYTSLNSCSNWEGSTVPNKKKIPRFREDFTDGHSTDWFPDTKILC